MRRSHRVLRSARSLGRDPVQYGIRDVSRPVHINRALREHGLLAVREELGHELLDAGASKAFAVADHQVAHVYVVQPARLTAVRTIVESLPGVERVLDARGKDDWRIGHCSGELVAIASPEAWFRTTTGSTMRGRRISRAPWRFTANPDTTRSSCSSIRHPDAGTHRRLEAGPPQARLPHAARRHPPRPTSRQRLARPSPAPTDVDAPVFLTKRKDLAASSPIRSIDVQSLLLQHLRPAD